MAWMDSDHGADLYMMEVVEADEALVAQLLAQQPASELLVCQGSDANVVAWLSRPVDGHAGSTPVTTLPKRDFTPSLAKQRLLGLPMPGAAHVAAPADRELFLSAVVDLGKELMVRAAGALLGHVAGSGVESADVQLHEVNASGTLRVSVDVFESLHIVRHEFHPSAAGIGSAKEGFSLYSLLNRARSIAGRQLLKKWLLRPLTDMATLQDRLDHVAYLRDPQMAGLVKQTLGVVGCIKDVRRICTKIVNLQSRCADWLALRNSLAAALEVRDLMRAAADTSALRVLRALQQRDDDSDSIANLGRLLAMLDSVIDLEESKSSKRLTVRAGVDAMLDELKNVYHGLGDLLTRVAEEQMKLLHADVVIDSLSTVYFPMIGYAIVVPRVAHVPVRQQLASLPEMDYLFDTDAFVYLKSPLTRTLDEELGDIHSLIVDRENMCIRELETHVLREALPLRHLVEVIAELDVLLAWASAANELRLVRPTLVPDAGVLVITAGRHPLQELCVDTFVANDTLLRAGRDGAVQLLTGPNASGKSVYLKQVGLIAYMAHIGCFVPAQSAVVGMLDAIYARIQTRESSSVAHSAFVLDLSQVATMLRHATPRSLLLLDEFGKGTDPDDGAALLGATLETIVARGALCVATTHFSQLFVPGVLEPDAAAAVQLLSMAHVVRADLAAAGAADALVLLYRLERGVAMCSLGDLCARKALVPSEVVDRALQVTQLLSCGKPVPRLESRAASSRVRLHKQVFALFMAFDVEHGDVLAFREQLTHLQQSSAAE